jgi:hypothetical protein
VRRALKDRLVEIGMTGRAFGKAFSANEGKGHVDTWVSGLLNGQFGLSLDELDEAARIVKMTPAALVQSDYEHAEYLTPTEHRIVQAMRALPASIRDHVLMLAEYLIGVAPDEIDMLEEYRELAAEEQTRVRHWMHVTRISREPAPGLAILPDLPERAGRPTAAEQRSRGLQRRKRK